MKNILDILNKPFPPEKIKTRKGSWDKEKAKFLEYSYVSSDDIAERLREAFGLSWSTKVVMPPSAKPEDFMVENDGKKEIVMSAIIEYTDPATGSVYAQTGFGSQQLKGMDFGNAMKSALSKAISNAAKKLGVGTDLDSDADDQESSSPSLVTKLESKPIGSSLLGKLKSKPNEEILVETGLDQETTPDDMPWDENTVTSLEAPKVEEKETEPKAKKTTSLLKKLASKETAVPAPSDAASCSDCSKEITEFTNKQNEVLEPEKLIKISQNFCKKTLCGPCLTEFIARKRNKQEESKA